ncbi:glycosyltransferase family 2 protein [Streptomyces sp. NPDC056831]|uniref:glycosyltransferase family 2 protein n=1 Tax=Streptomyces sp. NPDC056831 TaxID=3345954 RepID=UPI003690D6F8
MEFTQDPSVGVIIPVKDGARFIDQALASLKAQTHPVQQVVVVDDGSSDETMEKVKAWQHILPVVTLSNSKARGIWAARKQGIEVLETDTVLQLDADDFVLPEHVAKMLQLYREAPGLVSPVQFFWNEQYGLRESEPVKWKLPGNGTPLLQQIVIQNYVSVGAMYSRELYLSVGGYRETTFAQDWDLWIRLIAAGAPFAKADHPSYAYRVSKQSYSGAIDRNFTDLEVLDRFINETTATDGRAAAKLGVVQRMGVEYIQRLQDATCSKVHDVTQRLKALDIVPIEAPRVGLDPDLGDVIAVKDSRGAERLVIFEAGTDEVVLAGTQQEDRFEVTAIHNPDLRMLFAEDHWLGVMRGNRAPRI